MLRYKKIAGQDAILNALYTFPYLTVKQITRLLYAPGSIEGVMRKMKTLFDREIVLRTPLYSQSQATEYCYYLATKGRNLLREQGYPFEGWQEPKKMAPFLRSSQFPHYMETTDVLIQTTLLPSVNENLQVRGMMHYSNLNRYRKGSVIPDGWVDIHDISRDKELYYCVEVDRDTEEEKLSVKIGNILYYVTNGEYQQVYHAGERQPSIPIWLFFTSMGRSRGERILKLIEDMVVSSYATDKANWFRVLFTEGKPFHVHMFVEEIWLTPTPRGKRQLVRLFGE